MNTLQDRIRGSFIGGAAGDALGYPVEFFKDFREIQKRYGENGITKLTTPLAIGGEGYDKALISDDTQMTLFTANGILNAKRQKIGMKYGICLAYIEWYLTQIGKWSNRYKDCWIARIPEMNHRRGPGHTCMSSLYAIVEEMAADVCRLTHYDPRCVGSSVIVSMVIHQLIYHDYTMTPDEVMQLGRKYDDSIEFYVQRATDPDIACLMLDEKRKRGYTLKAMGAALWALWHPTNFVDGLVAIVNEGGDADTNGAPAGAILGARFGYNAIPAEYTEGLNRYKDLKREFEKLISIIQ